MSLIKTLAVLTALLFTTSALAEKLYVCYPSKCNSMLNKAKIMAMSHEDGEHFSVINFNENRVESYRVSRYFKYGEMFDDAEKIALTPHGQASLDKLLRIRKGLEDLEGGTRAKAIRIPSVLPNAPHITPEHGIDAVQLVLSSQTRELVGQYIHQHQSALDRTNKLVADITSQFDIPLLNEINDFTFVVFDNGTFAIYENVHEWAQGNYISKFVYKASFFTDGTTMPSNKNALTNGGNTNTYYLATSNDVTSFTTLIGNWGVTFDCKFRVSEPIKCETGTDGKEVCTTRYKCD